MARYADQSNPETISRWIREGRGQGEGAEYLPWLTIRDVPSRGLSTRIWGWKTQRLHHVLSLHELRYFFCQEWAEQVVDIREQFPLLPLSETLQIAKECGIRHPGFRGPRNPIVMTTDFLLKVVQGSSTKMVARTFKFAKDLDQRTVEKFEVERLYWLQRDIDWSIVTELDLPLTMVDNIASIHKFRDLSAYSVERNHLKRVQDVLQDNFLKNAKKNAGEITRITDLQVGAPAGTSWLMLKHLIANRMWIIDMRQPFRADRPLHSLRFSPHYTLLDKKEAA